MKSILTLHELIMININMLSTFSFGQGVTNVIMLKCNLAFLKEALCKKSGLPHRVSCPCGTDLKMSFVGFKTTHNLLHANTVCFSGLAMLSFKLSFRTNLEYQYQNRIIS